MHYWREDSKQPVYYAWSIFINSCQTIISGVHDMQSGQIDGSSHETCDDYWLLHSGASQDKW
jgi:hypothetical protein